MSPASLSVYFFLQAAIILLIARTVGSFVERWLGQPRVVGEMIAGVLLGPSLFGALAPETQAMLFPADSKPILFVIAQLGVGLYMFNVGLGFNRADFRATAKGAAAVSVAGMAAPFLVAVLIAPWLMATPGLFNPEVNQFEATLFMGAAIAITAFPMLARIIHERGLAGTPLGTLALSAGAIDDAAAWCLIALVLASFGDGPLGAWLAIGGGISFAIFMVWIAPRLLAPLAKRVEAIGEVDHTTLGFALIAYLLSAWLMDAIGIHAVFGGFLLGTAMPRGRLTDGLREKLEPMTVILLLPFFFTFSGLNTELLLIDNRNIILVALVIVVASIIAKAGACYFAARVTGQDHGTAMGIGALMNARGLMELIVLNIGLQNGIIGEGLFAILVAMAIITTFMATPLFEAFYGKKARRADELGGVTHTHSPPSQ